MNITPINKKLVEQSFKKSIDTYNNQAFVQNEICIKLLDQLIEKSGKRFNTVFEIGAGTGLLTQKLINRCDIHSFVLNDLVHAMSDSLLKICSSAEALECRFIAGDAEKIALPSSCDLVISASTIQWFENLSLFFDKVWNILNDDAIFAFSTFGPDNLFEVKMIEGSSLSYPSLSELSQQLSNKFDIMYLKEEHIITHFKSPKDILQHMKQTGVNGIESSRWTKNDLVHFTESYQKYSDLGKTFPLTYHPVYAICKKQKQNDMQ